MEMMDTEDEINKIKKINEYYNNNDIRSKNSIKKNIKNIQEEYEEKLNFDEKLNLDQSAIKSKVINDSCYDLQYEETMNYFLSRFFIGYQNCSYLAQHPIIYKCCSILGERALDTDWTLDNKNKDFLFFDKEIEIKKLLKNNYTMNNVFGVRHVLFLVDGADYSKPRPEKIPKGSYRGFKGIDAFYIFPQEWNSFDPLSNNFWEPEEYYIYGKPYHKSWMVVLKGDEPTDYLKPSYLFGGIPLTQQIYNAVYNVAYSNNIANSLLNNKRMLVVKSSNMQALSRRSTEDMSKYFKNIMNNDGIMIVGNDDDVKNVETNISSINELIEKNFRILASISGIPYKVLMDEEIKGFSSTGENEMKNLYRKLKEVRSDTYDTILNKHYMLLSQSLDQEFLGYEWESLEGESNDDLLAKAKAYEILVNIGAMDAEDVYKEFNKGKKEIVDD